MTPRVFIDSSVLFSAANSTRGHSHDLIRMGARGEIVLVLSDYVFEETRRNLGSLSPPKETRLDEIISSAAIEIVEVTRKEVLNAAKIVVLKDAPILAAAKAAKVDMLVSLDKKHLLGRPELVEFLGAGILSPKEAFEQILTLLEK
jgi:predicted nucleic acid-binding protein